MGNLEASCGPPSILFVYETLCNYLGYRSGVILHKETTISLEYSSGHSQLTFTSESEMPRIAHFRGVGKISLHVPIDTKASLFTFYVQDVLATSIAPICDFCYRHKEAIRPPKRLIGLDNGRSLSIVRKPLARTKITSFLPVQQVYILLKMHTSAKNRFCRQVVVHPGM